MKKSIFIVLIALAFIQVNAQKLPKVQTASLRAPVKVKIDGKPLEWNTMQAYNPSGEIFYTLANDDENLYLVIQSNKRDMVLKLINGGVTLMIQKTGKKNDVGEVGIKFPFMEKGQRVGVVDNNDTDKGRKQDPTITNKNISTKVKWIYTKGLLGKDSLIPIYNDVGILARNALDNNGTYTSELAIDLKLIGLSKNINKFAYHIIINGEPNKYVETFNQEKWHVVNRDGSPVTASQLEIGKHFVQSELAKASSTSDFWGDYTLAK